MRVKRGTVSRRKHNKLQELTKGYRGTRNRLTKVAHEAALHAGAYAYHGRKLRKRDARALWITRISGATSEQGLSYSVFMHKLKQAHIELDRKILSQLVVEDRATFKHIVDNIRSVN